MTAPDFSIELQSLLKEITKKIAVAVSGGADSFALLHMAHQWAMQNDVGIVAMTVDHGLRAESATEAQIVADWCKRHGIPHQTLHWQGEKPRTGVQATARKMRRKLLCAACVEHGIDTLLLGHQADDQAETMLMRLQRGSGLKGLRVMHPVTRHKASGVRLVRPLLHRSRAELRQYCLDHQLPFIDDPSNEKIEFERVRLRKLLQQLPELAGGIVKSTDRLRRADETLDKLAQIWFDQHVQCPDPHSFWVPHSFVTALLPELKIRVLALLLQSRALGQIETLCEALHKPDFTGLTMAGSWVKPKVFNKQPGFLFQPEPARKINKN